MTEGAEARRREDRVALWVVPLAILGVFLLDLFLSLYVWHAWPADWWMYKLHTFTGLFLWVVPVATLMEGAFIWWPWQPFVWLAAWGSGAAVAWWARGLNPANRWLYAGLMTLIMSGFASSEWSTVGS